MSVATASILHPQLDIEERLEPAHEQIVRDTLPLVGKHVEEIAPVFYGRMFVAHPELLRNTFNRGNQAQGAQQKALVASVATSATLLVAVYYHQARTLIAAGAAEERMHVELFSPNDWLLPGA